MLQALDCLTYPDVVRHLDGTSARSVCSCSKCSAVVKTMRALIQEPSVEETMLLDQIETRPLLVKFEIGRILHCQPEIRNF
jgi:hypothetical protein